MEKKNNTINSAAGLITGYGVYKLTPIVGNKIRRATITRFLDTPLTPDQVAVYKQAGLDLFESKFYKNFEKALNNDTVLIYMAIYLEDNNINKMKEYLILWQT